MRLKKIVFIEDDPLDFEVFKTALTSLSETYKISHEVDVDANFFDKYDPRECIIFLDLRLGYKNGRDIFLEKLKEENYITFILSSSDDPNDIKKCCDIGLAGYLQKKDNIDAVFKQVMSTVEFVTNNLLYFPL